MMSPNKQNLVIFRTEICDILGKMPHLERKISVLRHIAKQNCHIKTFIGFNLLCTR